MWRAPGQARLTPCHEALNTDLPKPGIEEPWSIGMNCGKNNRKTVCFFQIRKTRIIHPGKREEGGCRSSG